METVHLGPAKEQQCSSAVKNAAFGTRNNLNGEFCTETKPIELANEIMVLQEQNLEKYQPV